MQIRDKFDRLIRRDKPQTKPSRKLEKLTANEINLKIIDSYKAYGVEAFILKKQKESIDFGLILGNKIYRKGFKLIEFYPRENYHAIKIVSGEKNNPEFFLGLSSEYQLDFFKLDLNRGISYKVLSYDLLKEKSKDKIL